MAGPGPTALLEIDSLAVRRGSFSVAVPALSLAPGGVAALHGASGTGKSTALAAAFGLLDGRASVAGSVRWRGAAWRALDAERRRHVLRSEIAFLAQDAASALDPLARVGRQIGRATGCTDAEAAAALERLGVAGATALCRRWPHQISGGEAQRVLLAIAVLRAPALVVADEPTANLDAHARAELLAHLRALLAGGASLLLASHDQQLARELDAAVFVHGDGAFVPGRLEAESWPTADRADVGSVPVLRAEGLSVSFGARAVLRAVDLAVHRGEIVALTGSSGAGKTTLARVLAGQLQPAAGTIVRPPRARAVQLVPQDAFASLTPRRTVRELAGETGSRAEIEALAARLQLAPDLLDRTAAELSSGQRRRAALLRALTVRPDVLVLDEPTAGLDAAAARAVVQLVLSLQRERGMAVVLVTHDLELARAAAHRTVTIEEGSLWHR